GFLVTPPTAAQGPGPAATISGPRTAVTGTDSLFRAQGSERGGSISAYYWTFGDGRTSNSTGPDVTHVYSEAGTYTASVTVTSSLGTISTHTQDVAVFRASDGSLAQTYLGASGWATQELPGQPADNSNIVATTTAGGGPAVFYVD